MDSYTRAKPRLLHWLLITALLAVVLLAPAAVATSVTSPDEPVGFMSEPWQGWKFTGEVLRTSVSASAASPGDALEAAHRHWPAGTGSPGGDDTLLVVEVALLYLPAGEEAVVTTHTGTEGGARRGLTARKPLAWQVRGYRGRSTELVTIGLIDFSTGDVLWDVRDSSKEARTT